MTVVISDSISASAGSLQTTKVKRFSQGWLNDLVIDLALSKKAAETIASCLSEHGILDPKTMTTTYYHRDEVLNCYFSEKDNIGDLLTSMDVPKYKLNERQLFINSS